MCGIVGFSGFYKADPSKIRILLMDNETRGRDSTGVYGKRLMRKLGKATDFINDVNFDHICRSNIVVGHTRNSTTTKVSKDTAHPFVFDTKNHGKIVGTHNGWLVNEHEVEKKLSELNFKRAEVDSESIYKAMALTEDKEIFKLFEGAMALAFIFDGKLYLFRRKSRPLFVGRAKEGYYYSSLKDSLKKIGIVDENLFELKPDVLMELTGSRITNSTNIDPQRIEFESYTTSYNWKNLVKSPELMEELTGKKPEPETNTIGFRTKNTQSYEKRTGTETDGVNSTRKDGSMNYLLGHNATLEDMKSHFHLPRLHGSDIFLPSEASKSGSIYSQLNSFLYERGLSSAYIGSTRYKGFQDMTPFWPLDPSFTTCVVSPMIAGINGKFLDSVPKNGKISHSMYGTRINFRMFNSYLINGGAYEMNEENHFMVACFTVKGKAGQSAYKGMVMNKRGVKDIYVSNSVLGIPGCKIVDIELDIFLINVMIPGIVSKTKINIESGYEYYFDFITKWGDFHDFRKTMFSNRGKAEGSMSILNNINIEKYREVYSNYRSSHFLISDAYSANDFTCNKVNEFTRSYNEELKKKLILQGNKEMK